MVKIALRILPTYYSFLSGVCVSVAANLFTGVFGSDTLPTKTQAILLSAAFAFFSSLAWLLVAIVVEEVRGTISALVKAGVDVDKAKLAAIQSTGGRIMLAVGLALTLTTICFVVLARGQLNSGPETAKELTPVTDEVKSTSTPIVTPMKDKSGQKGNGQKAPA